MAHSRFPVEVVTPEGTAFQGEVEMVSTRTALGQIAILAHHEPLLALLEPTELRLYRTEQEVVRLAQGEGYIQFQDNQALLLVEEAVPPDRLDRDQLAARITEARALLEQAQPGSEERARAERELARAEAFQALLS
jgi:F-type H+-transporting ATPase subunit epsilon